MKLNRICFLDADTFGLDFDFSAIEKLAPLTVFGSTSAEQTLERVAGFEAVITNKVVLDESILRNAPSLKLICVAATGTNNIDLKAAESRGIHVCNAVAYSTNSVAQHCLALCLELMHKNRHRNMRARSDWSHSEVFSMVGSDFEELSSKRWGILGLGAIGSRVAELAHAFGAEVVYHSVSEGLWNTKFECVTLDELITTSDILSIHTSLRASTRYLFDKSRFNSLKQGVIFLNMARGEICEPTALLDWLRHADYGGVGLDVLEQEPPVLNHPVLLLEDPRILITPHMAWTSVQSRQRLLETIIDNIDAFQRGQLINGVRSD